MKPPMANEYIASVGAASTTAAPIQNNDGIWKNLVGLHRHAKAPKYVPECLLHAFPMLLERLGLAFLAG
jgi:hypothetical protein